MPRPKHPRQDFEASGDPGVLFGAHSLPVAQIRSDELVGPSLLRLPMLCITSLYSACCCGCGSYFSFIFLFLIVFLANTLLALVGFVLSSSLCNVSTVSDPPDKKSTLILLLDDHRL